MADSTTDALLRFPHWSHRVRTLKQLSERRGSSSPASASVAERPQSTSPAFGGAAGTSVLMDADVSRASALTSLWRSSQSTPDVNRTTPSALQPIAMASPTPSPSAPTPAPHQNTTTSSLSLCRTASPAYIAALLRSSRDIQPDDVDLSTLLQGTTLTHVALRDNARLAESVQRREQSRVACSPYLLPRTRKDQPLDAYVTDLLDSIEEREIQVTRRAIDDEIRFARIKPSSSGGAGGGASTRAAATVVGMTNQEHRHLRSFQTASWLAGGLPAALREATANSKQPYQRVRVPRSTNTTSKASAHRICAELAPRETIEVGGKVFEYCELLRPALADGPQQRSDES